MADFSGTEATGALITSLEGKKPYLWRNINSWAVNHPPRYPWRRLGNPYDVLIGELLLEKARTAPVIARERFLRVFPSVNDLLATDEEEVSRALERLHMQRFRQSIMGLFRGLAASGRDNLPGDSETLAGITGLERHHIRAVLCFGFGMPVAVVDGHVRRLLKRIFAGVLPHHPSIGLIETIAESLVYDRDPQTYNGVLLDLAELICRPEMPWCQACPLSPICDTALGPGAPDSPAVPRANHSLVRTGGG